MDSRDYDLAVIGSGPAGQKAAIAAAKLGKRVAIFDRPDMLGGVCLHTGTIPSKTLREAVLYLTGFRQRGFYGKDYTLKSNIQISDLMFRVGEVVKRQQAVVRDQLGRNGIVFVPAMVRFADPHTLEADDGSITRPVTADFILIGCGTRPARPDDVPFKERRVIDADGLIQTVDGELARSVIVVGAGVIGLEYASMAAALGLAVTVVEARDSMLAYVDSEITEALSYHLRRIGVTFRLGETVVSIRVDEGAPVCAHLASGKVINADRLLYAVGRQANTVRLNLQSVGIAPDDRGRLKVNDYFQTEVPHIYAGGDVVGFPSLASTSMEQGRLAACHMFGVACDQTPLLLPYGIYSIPEISMVGKTEKQLTEDCVPYEVGVAAFEELTRAQIQGERVGLLKIIFHTETRELLGIHIFGEGATELVHIGQMAMATGGTLETIRDTVFNYPTMAEAYKVAATNGLNKLASSEVAS